MKVAVSYLNSDVYKDCIKKIDGSNADYIHVDLCDGKYVKTKNFTIKEVINLLKNVSKPLDIHLMCKNPIKYIDDLATLNTQYITVHLDSMTSPLETINYIKDIGIQVGIALNPKDSINMLKDYYEIIDKVLFMSVVPGKGGQAFMPSILPKIEKINETKKDYHFITSVDGGINEETVDLLKDKDIDIIVSGSFVTNSDNYSEQINKLKK